MNDCLNAEMRDRLPDLMHERLPANVRAEVTAHVAACADCREELELLRGLRATLAAAAPRVDIADVVAALPKPPVRAVPRVARQRTWTDWRIAATVTLLAVGGSSVALINRAQHISPAAELSRQQLGDTPATVPSRELSNAPSGGTSKQTAISPTRPTNDTIEQDESAGLGMSGHLADLDDDQLQALINEIEGMKAVPITEPEPISIKVNVRNVSNPGTR